MTITAEQYEVALRQQQAAAEDQAPQVRIVAGPGTGKSRTIEARVLHALRSGVAPNEIFVITFTRATRAELANRIQRAVLNDGYAEAAESIRIQTMHSLALRILQMQNLLTNYPSEPVVLDDWEQTEVYDQELAYALGASKDRAKAIRTAHDAFWHTLNPGLMRDLGITPEEVTTFNAFHSARTNLYSCVLPGEIIFKCVDAYRNGELELDRLPTISHLIVDEYQDLNLCDQEFIRLLCAGGARLFVAGDDDQSIYGSLRHADPAGIVNFPHAYPESSTHVLRDCFRCAPRILDFAGRVIALNPGRIPKDVRALYGEADPPVQGTLEVWKFETPQDEARAVAESCKALIDAGMEGREDEIVILISSRNLQLRNLVTELEKAEVGFALPDRTDLADEDAIRSGYCLLRICREYRDERPDYPAYRDLLGLLSGVGKLTITAIIDGCFRHRQNFHDLFHLDECPHWVEGKRSRGAVERVTFMAKTLAEWTLDDTLEDRADALSQMLELAGGYSCKWNEFAARFPAQTKLGEVLDYLEAGTEDEQRTILAGVHRRLGLEPPEQPQAKVRILTMHGAKGLTASVVFIPSVEQKILPSTRSLRTPAGVIEHRRLFYVSLTRARAACIVSHAQQRTGADAQAVAGQFDIQMNRSQYIREAGYGPSIERISGLTQVEAHRIVTDVNNMN